MNEIKMPEEVSNALVRMMRDSALAIRYLEDMVTVWCWIQGQKTTIPADLKLMRKQVKMAATLGSLFRSLAERWAGHKVEKGGGL